MSKLVRLETGPLPLTGLVKGETTTIDGKTPLLVVAVYGYNPNKAEYWRKADCRDLTAEESARVPVDQWLALAKRNHSGR